MSHELRTVFDGNYQVISQGVDTPANSVRPEERLYSQELNLSAARTRRLLENSGVTIITVPSVPLTGFPSSVVGQVFFEGDLPHKRQTGTRNALLNGISEDLRSFLKEAAGSVKSSAYEYFVDYSDQERRTIFNGSKFHTTTIGRLRYLHEDNPLIRANLYRRKWYEPPTVSQENFAMLRSYAKRLESATTAIKLRHILCKA